MSDLLDRIQDTFPANGDVGVPLRAEVTVTLSGLDYDEDSLKEGFFLEGPDTDQFIGPAMLSLKFPSNVSQGDFDDFFESPGRKGIVKAVVTVSGISGNTLVTLTPELPLAANIEYVANLTGVLDSLGSEIDGFVSFSFTSGSGSIEEVPASTSSSVLSSSSILAGSTSSDSLAVVRTIPADHEVEVDPDLDEIIIEFNKSIDPSSVSIDSVLVETYPATDHPSANTNSAGVLATSVEVDGRQLKVKI